MTCKNCGLTNPPDARFCNSCAAPLGGPLPPPPPPTLFAKPPVAPKQSSSVPKIIGGLVLLFALIVLGRACSDISQPGKQAASQGATATRAPAGPAPIEGSNLWSESESTSAMDGKTTIVLSRKSDDSYQAWIGSYTPRVVVQCYTKGHPDVFVDLHSAASVEYGDELHTVRLKFDAGLPEKQRWTQSKDDEGLFARSPGPLISEMEKHKTLLFEFDPFNTPTTATVGFDLDGLPQSLAKHKECQQK